MTTDLIARLREAAATGKPGCWNMLATSELYAAADALEAKERESAELRDKVSNQLPEKFEQLKAVAAEMARQLRGILVDYEGYESGRQINKALDAYKALIGEKP